MYLCVQIRMNRLCCFHSSPPTCPLCSLPNFKSLPPTKQKPKIITNTRYTKLKLKQKPTPPQKGSILCWPITPDTLLGKTDFLFPSRHQLLIVSWLGVSLYAHLPFSMLGICLVWISARPVHAVTTFFLNSYVHQSYYVWKIPFPWNHLLYLLKSFHLFSINPWALGTGAWFFLKKSHLGLGAPKSLSFCTLSSGGSVIHCKELLWWALSSALIHGYSCNIRIHFIPDPLTE